jgi:hypothetical protein
VEVWREPVPRTVVSEAYVHATRPVVTGHEPPNVGVEVPARLDENVVHTLNDAVSIHPDVVTVAVTPISVHPNASGAQVDRLFDDYSAWRGRRLRGRGDRLGLLNDDDRLPVDLLCLPVFFLDHYIGARVERRSRLALPCISIVADVELGCAARSVPVGAVVICTRRAGQHRGHGEGEENPKTNGASHSPSSICASNWACRHPLDLEQARPARQSARKVLGFWQF